MECIIPYMLEVGGRLSPEHLREMSWDCLTPEEQKRRRAAAIAEAGALAQAAWYVVPLRRIPPEWLRPARYHPEDLAATGKMQVGHPPPVAGTEGTGGPWPPEPE